MIQKLLLAAALTVSAGLAGAAPVLSKVSPGPFNYTHDVDFYQMAGSGFGDVTARLFAVDLVVPSLGGGTSGCEAADFVGFVAGSIALMQRGTCEFSVKAQNAEAAGAVGALIFNEGNTPDQLGVIYGTLQSYVASTVVFGASFAVGDELRNGVSNGLTGVTVRMKLEESDLQTVPEPASLALVGAALLGLAGIRRRARVISVE